LSACCGAVGAILVVKAQHPGMKMTKINKPRTKPKALFFERLFNRDMNLTNLIVLGKIEAGEAVLILIFYQKLPSQTISYKIINIFASLWRGEIPFCPQVRSPI
jgi:hypothetical protein